MNIVKDLDLLDYLHLANNPDLPDDLHLGGNLYLVGKIDPIEI